jgi:hypothetical protein
VRSPGGGGGCKMAEQGEGSSRAAVEGQPVPAPFRGGASEAMAEPNGARACVDLTSTKVQSEGRCDMDNVRCTPLVMERKL